MDKEILNELRAIFKEELKAELEPIKADIKEIKEKMDSVYDQTADLTEFRTDTTAKLDKLINVTKDNCFEIANLKIVK